MEMHIHLMPRTPNTDELAVLLDDEEIRHPSARAQALYQYMESGVGAFFGTWPGDETDEELQAMLREVRKG